MTRLIHDQFAKQYLKELLSARGNVETSRDVTGEARQIDVFFVPFAEPPENVTPLGLLDKIATTSCVFEPFRNPITRSEIRSCMGKLFDVCAEKEREVRGEKRRITEDELPVLWLLTPTISQTIISEFNANSDTKNWLEGVYSLGEGLKTKIVAIHQLPRTPETLWLRMLGKGRVQRDAMSELRGLSAENQINFTVLELVYNLLTRLEVSQELDREDRELIMELSPIYLQRLENATQEGVKQGVQQGLQQGKRIVVENLLRVRFGSLDDQLSAIVEPLVELPVEEFTPLLVQLSREELLARFPN
ncbi:MAG: hypothetical protein SXA11_25930 [Cyanobacteriota bacterium]|nr:hypothetical protein [Cyanobacteriota bacterium]